jgi:phosphohistidine phosphatase SixA
MGQTKGVRYLIVVRHAKSSPAAPGGSDFDRVLSGRGRKQCKQLRVWADDDESLGRYGPVTALVSSAARTRETFERAFEGTAMIAQQVLDKSIYNGTREVSGEDLLHALIDIDPLTTSLMVVAHNPSVHELAIVLARVLPDSLRFHNYALGGAYVFALTSGEPLRHERYEIVDSFIPD